MHQFEKTVLMYSIWKPKIIKQPDGTFLIETERWEQKTVLAVIGRIKDKPDVVPCRNAWLYIDPATIGTHSLSNSPDWM